MLRRKAARRKIGLPWPAAAEIEIDEQQNGVEPDAELLVRIEPQVRTSPNKKKYSREQNGEREDEIALRSFHQLQK